MPSPTAPKTHPARTAFFHLAQYTFCLAALKGLAQDETSTATAYGILSLYLEVGFESVCNLAKSLQKSAALNLSPHYSYPTKLGLGLFNGLAISYRTFSNAIQSGIDNINKEYGSNKGHQL